MATLAALGATLFLVSAPLVWRRPAVFWASVVGLDGCTLAILIIGGHSPVSDFVVVWAFVVLGPMAAVLCLLRLRVLTSNLFLAVVTAVVGFVCAAGLWAIIAVNVGALEP